MDSKLIGMRLTYFLLAIILVIYGLIMAKDFLYPLAFGVLLAYMLYPIVNFLEKKGMPRIFPSFCRSFWPWLCLYFWPYLFLNASTCLWMNLPYFQGKNHRSY